ncbi:MAG: hypothetical protein K2I96_11130 [Lachnospiraceae bacterium]|nr:hypothetical protein [Lachnospiraceae bacterium]
MDSSAQKAELLEGRDTLHFRFVVLVLLKMGSGKELFGKQKRNFFREGDPV